MPDVTLDVVFPLERDIPAWQTRHDEGLVPGHWPYGLDRLGTYVDTIRALPLPEPGRRQVLGHRLREALPKAPGGRGERRVGIAWDENAARRMLYSSPRPEMYCGVIWVTDVLARGGDIGTMRSVLRRMNGLWVISSGQLEAVRNLVGDDGPPVGFFPFGVDHDFFAATAYPERPLVLSVGGDRDRDTSTLFEALAEVHRASPETEILVQTSSELIPPDGITRVAHVPHRELARLYQRASVVAIATRQNLHTSGMTVSLEAMATGRPVVMTDTPGIRDYLSDGETGHLVPVVDATALAERVLRLLADPDAAATMGAAGRASVERSFTTAHLVDGIASFTGLSGRPARGAHSVRAGGAS